MNMFDLWLYPCERENRVLGAEYSAVYTDLSARLEQWMISTTDPLITHGSRVPKPQGARTVRLSQASPRVADYEN